MTLDSLLNFADYYLLQVVTFTIWQAILSTMVSLIGGVLLGRLIYSQQWSWVEKWLMLPVMMPTLSITIGYMSIFSQFNDVKIIGLPGIIICHCFFNIPIAALLIIKGYQQVPASSWQLAYIQRLSITMMISKIEIPLLKKVIINISCLIFAYCFSSFSIPLLMGGGPRTNTLTVELYYSLIVQGQNYQAIVLLIIKICVGGLILLMTNNLSERLATERQNDPLFSQMPPKYPKPLAIVITMSILMIMIPPLLALAQHLTSDIARLCWQERYTHALINSLGLAAASTLTVMTLSILILTLKSSWRLIVERSAYLLLMIPSFVMGYLIIKISFSCGIYKINAWLSLLLINCAVSLPMALRTLCASWQPVENHYNHLIRTLHLPWWVKLHKIILPLIAPALRLSKAFTISYCLGDVGGILLFDQQQIVTMPSIICETSNQFDYATARLMSGLMIAITFIVFIVIHKKVRT